MNKPETARLGLIPFVWLVGIVLTLSGCIPLAEFRGVREEIMFKQFPTKGQFVDYRRNVPTRAQDYPLEATSDGFKMVRIFRDMDEDMVEWMWRVTLRNKTTQEVVVTLDYHLQDEDALPVTTSQAVGWKIPPGQTVSLEKTDFLPYAKAIRVTGSSWDIQLHN
jgi:hypothetical protein